MIAAQEESGNALCCSLYRVGHVSKEFRPHSPRKKSWKGAAQVMVIWTASVSSVVKSDKQRFYVRNAETISARLVQAIG